jgi:ectoine hydroxylase-related dioxygenase (phytanoyl-CoA dioxygenase family)
MAEFERLRGGSPSGDDKRKMHLSLQWVDEIIHNPNILDAVEDVIGPDILCYHVSCWLKEPQTDATVSWHQDHLYFGLDPQDSNITAWIGITASNAQNGCMQVIPGSHLAGPKPHRQHGGMNLFQSEHNIDIDPDAPQALIEVGPGQFSLHHTYLLHSSRPNQSNARRLGLAISYIPTSARGTSGLPLSATLVRGTDRYGHFMLDQRPKFDLDPAAVAQHDAAVERWHAARRVLIPRAHAEAAE